MEVSLVLWFLVGLGLLVAGAELFVRGASRLALIWGISPLVIGLTIVAYGTSSPEVAVSLQAALVGNEEVALGNVVGSNIANILLILGLSAVIYPLAVTQRLLRIEIPLVLAISLFLYFLAWDLRLSFGEGLLLVFLSVLYTVVVVWQSKKEESEKVKAEYEAEYGENREPEKKRGIWVALGMVLGGLVLLCGGGIWLVDSSSKIALALGVSELVTGLTIVAVGTSFPELATSIMAAIKKESDIAIGNIVGSNLFNILFILGSSSVVTGKGLAVKSAVLNFDIPFMIVVTFALLPVCITGFALSRWEGGLFVLYYGAYVTYLIMASKAHQQLDSYTAALSYTAPLVLLTLVLLALWPWIRQKRDGN